MTPIVDEGRSRGSDRRAGILVPPENPTVEPEMVALLGSRMPFHIARLPLTASGDLRERLDGYRAGLDQTLDRFGELALSEVFIACTGAFYTIGPVADEQLCLQLSERHGVSVQTATQVILGMLRGHGATRLLIVSPYPSWLTEAACAYWTAAGFDVIRRAEISGGRPIYSIGAEDVLASLDEVARTADDVDAILVSGTGVPTVAAIEALAPRVAPFILSSNLCGGRWLMGCERTELGGRP